MSYMVHLWEHPRRTSLAAAERLHQVLIDRPSAPNAKWRQLRHAIEARMVAQGTPREWIEYPIDPGHRERSQASISTGPTTTRRWWWNAPLGSASASTTRACSP